jgi:hypothetical protein
MKIRAIGTGSPYCRHPLVTSSFLVQSENSNVIIGCGFNIPAKLETINLSIDQIDMWIPLNSLSSEVAGLEEVALRSSKKPYLVAPSDLLSQVEKRLSESGLVKKLKNHFEMRASTKITINEEHLTETVTFIRNHLSIQPSYGLSLDESEIFISGETPVNDEFLHRHGMPAEIILHSYSEGLKALPVYMQQKIWIYGYDNNYLNMEEPIPMLFIPQGTCVYDSDRKEKHLDKERFIRENAKRQIGNLTAQKASDDS